jgi:hypothetical protein
MKLFTVCIIIIIIITNNQSSNCPSPSEPCLAGCSQIMPDSSWHLEKNKHPWIAGNFMSRGL